MLLTGIGFVPLHAESEPEKKPAAEPWAPSEGILRFLDPSLKVGAIVKVKGRITADGDLIADAPARTVLSGGWYFSSEVARVLDRPGLIAVEEGARLIGDPAATEIRE